MYLFFLSPSFMACVNQDIYKSDTVVDSASPSQTDLPEDSENNTNDNPVDEPEEGFSVYVDPMCLDGQYTEDLPNPNADITSEINSYNSSNYTDFILNTLGIRYPVGKFLVQNGLQSEGIFSENCIEFFLYDSSSPQSVISEMSTIVHECGHFFNLNMSGWGENVYFITDTQSFSCTDGSIPSNGGGVTFSRSLIKNDAYYSSYPSCEDTGGSNCDFYASTYLGGDPNDGNFDSGDQGFGMLHEETVQYVNSLATAYAFQDNYQNYSVTQRDGILTFLWYTQRYLKMAREQYPETYEKLSQDSCWRANILTTWGRAWFYLEATRNNSNLGINDDYIEELINTSELLDEIEYLRELQGCP